MENKNPISILVVDDNPAGLYTTTKALKMEGFNTYEAVTGYGALESVKKYLPDVVLLDVKLPDISGFEVCKLIKADPKISAIPVIHLSATYLDSESKVIGLQGGADAYLTHPVEPKVLTATINAMLRIRQAEAKVRAAGIRWQTTFDAINDGVCLIDKKGLITHCNTAFAQIISLPQEQIIAKNLTFFSSEFEKYCPEFFVKIFNEKLKGEKCETMFRGNWYLTSVDSIHDVNESYDGSVFKMTDITTEKRSEEKIKLINKGLKELNTTKDKLLSIISHDLRGPFSGFIGLAKGLVNDTDKLSKEEIAEYGAAIFQTAKRLYDLLNNILEWAKLQSGTIQINPVDINLHQEVEDVKNLFSASLSEKMLNFENNVAPHIYVFTDKHMLSTIITNLISNAVKFSDKSGKITVNAQRKDNDLVLSISDQGTGIEPEMLDKLFRIDSSFSTLGTKGEEGTGFGLKLCKEMVEKNGGILWVESTLNEGSTFSFTFPLNNKFI